MGEHMHAIMALCYGLNGALVYAACYIFEAWWSDVNDESMHEGDIKIPQGLEVDVCWVVEIDAAANQTNWQKVNVKTLLQAEAHRESLMNKYHEARFIWVGFDQHTTLDILAKSISSQLLPIGRSCRKWSGRFPYAEGNVDLKCVRFQPDTAWKAYIVSQLEDCGKVALNQHCPQC